MLKNGWYEDMQPLDSLEYISWSKIMKMHESEKHFYDRYILGNVSDQTEAQRVGGITHSALLEPAKFRENYKSYPNPNDIEGCLVTVDDLKKKAIELEIEHKKSIKKSELVGLLLQKDPSLQKVIWDCILEDYENSINGQSIRIKDSDGQKIINMLDSVSSHPFANKLLKNSAKEINGYFYDEELGIWFLIKPDIYKPTKSRSVMADLKSTSSAKNDQFGKSISDYGYHIQAAYYMDIAEKIQGKPVDDYYHIAVESKAPWITEVEYLLPEDVEIGRIIWRTEAERIVKCIREHKKQAKKYWYGYSQSTKPKPSKLPAWYLNRIQNDERYFL